MVPCHETSITKFAVAIASLVLPRRHGEWRDAMLAEMAALPPQAQASWAIGLAFAACRLRIREPAFLSGASTAALAALLVTVDWSTMNDALPLGTLLAGAALRGYMRPKTFMPSALVLGMVLLGAHTLANLTGWALPFYQYKPLAAADFATLASLLLPAIASAKAGAALRTIVHSERHM